MCISTSTCSENYFEELDCFENDDIRKVKIITKMKNNNGAKIQPAFTLELTFSQNFYLKFYTTSELVKYSKVRWCRM